MEGTTNLLPSSLDVFNDYKARKAGLIKALSTDVHNFYQQCDPDPEMEDLGLYGLPNETWEVRPPDDEVPPVLPEPALGMNKIRDDWEPKDWLSYVAIHGDTWLLSVAYYLGGQYGFDKSQREELFDMINEEPTLFEAVTGAHKPAKDQASAENNGSKNKSSDRMPSGVFKMTAPDEEDESEWDEEEEEQEVEEEEVEEEEEQEEVEEEEVEEEEVDEKGTACGTCGGIYAEHEFWICCDICEIWFHGKCVKITAAKADHVKLYKCPTCKTKKAKKAS